MAKTLEGDIADKHNLDGRPHKAGQGEEHTCYQSWARVTLTEGDGSIIISATEAIIPRCPNTSCSAVDLKVVNLRAKA